MARPKIDESEVLGIECPVCKVERGARCHFSNGRIKFKNIMPMAGYHSRRWVRARQLRDEVTSSGDDRD